MKGKNRWRNFRYLLGALALALSASGVAANENIATPMASLAETNAFDSLHTALDGPMGGPGELTLVWRWQPLAEVKYAIVYNIGKQELAATPPFGSSKGAVAEVRWSIPFGAVNVRLQAIKDKIVVGETQPITLKTFSPDEIAAHEHHEHMAHVAPGAATSWKFFPARAKAPIEPETPPSGSSGTCPAGSGGQGPRGFCPDRCKTPYSVGDPVSVTDGSFWLDIPGFIVGGAGRPIMVNLNYNTHKWADKTGYTGLGVGWSMGFQRRLAEMVIEGKTYIYLIDDGGVFSWWERTAQGALLTTPDNRATLSQVGQTYELKYLNGHVDVFDINGKLTRVFDDAGNASVLSAFVIGADGKGRKSITNVVTGQGLTLEHTDINGVFKLTRIVEFGPGLTAPRQMTLEYGTAGGNLNQLVRVTDQAGRRYTFEYESPIPTHLAGRMVKYWDPLNDPATNPSAVATVNEYAIPTWGKTTNIDHGDWDRLAVKTQTRADRRIVFDLDYRGRSGAGTTAVNSYDRAMDYQLMQSGSFQSALKETFNVGSTGLGVQIVVGSPMYGSTRSFTRYDANSMPYSTTIPGYGDFDRVLDTRGNVKESSRFDSIVGKTLVSTYSYDTKDRVIQSTSPENIRMNYTYDANKNWLTSVSQTATIDGTAVTRTTSYSYGAVPGFANNPGLVTAITYPNGSVTTQSYDSLGYPAVLTVNASGDGSSGANGSNRKTTTQFDGRGFLMSVVDHRGVRTNYEYTNNPAAGQFGNLGVVSAVVYAAGTAQERRAEFVYDRGLNLLKSTNYASNSTASTSASVQMKYAPHGKHFEMLPIEVIAPDGAIVRYEYNRVGDLTKMTEVAAANGADRVTTWAYQVPGYPSSVTRADGSTTRFVYNGNGQLVKTIDPRGVATEVLYDTVGRTTKVTVSKDATGAADLDAVSIVRQFQYDTADRLIRSSTEGGNTSDFLYSTWTYDGLSRLASYRNTAGRVTTYQYNNQTDHLISASFGGVTTAMTYDLLGRLLTRQVNPASSGPLVRYSYSSNPQSDLRPLSITNPKGNITSYTYDPIFGNLQVVTEANGNSTSYGYDWQNSLVRVSPGDAAGNLTAKSTTYTRDIVGRTLSLSRDAQTERWSYNIDGSIKTHTQFSSQTVNYAYDVLGRQIAVDYSGTPSDPTGARSDAQFTYYPNDSLKTATSKPDGITAVTTTYNYDPGARLTSRTRNNKSMRYEYNNNGQTTRMQLYRGSVGSYPSNVFSWNSTTGELTVVDAIRRLGPYTWGDAGELMSSGSSTTTRYQYDSLKRATAITYKGSTTPNLTFAYDANGNRTTTTQTYLYEGQPRTATDTFSYDVLDRLTNANLGVLEGLSPALQQSFTYDSVGNRLTVTEK